MASRGAVGHHGAHDDRRPGFRNHAPARAAAWRGLSAARRDDSRVHDVRPPREPIAQRLFISEKAVGKHSTSIFAKLDLAPSTDDNRRVLAVLAFLNS
jgi:hypothetical protein